MDILLVALGGATGAVSRYLAGNGISKWLGSGWPYGTFIINVVGCFFMGLLMTLIVGRNIIPSEYRLVLCVGFLGGFTTFSSFGYETWTLLFKGEMVAGLGYAFGSLFLGVVAAAIGVFIGRAI